MQSIKNIFKYILILYYIINVYCEDCAPGKHYFLNKCRYCISGTYSPSGKRCYNCDPGTYAMSIGSIMCDPCRPGSYTNEYGSSGCFLCEPGSYTPYSGMTGCFSCPSGYTSSGGAAECYKIKNEKKSYNSYYEYDYYYDYDYY